MNKVSRRDILRHLLVAGGVALSPNLIANDLSLVESSIIRWESMEPWQLKSLVGNVFSAHSEEASCDMVLKAVHVSDIDPGRPEKLIRSQSYIAVFSPFEGYECFKNDQILELIHPNVLGYGQLYVSVKRSKEGESYMEVVFN